MIGTRKVKPFLQEVGVLGDVLDVCQDYVIKGLCQSMERSSSLHIPTLPSLVVTDMKVMDI